MKKGSQWLIIDFNNPWNWIISIAKMWVIEVVINMLGKAKKWESFNNQSIITRIVVLPLETYNPTMKSSDMSSKIVVGTLKSYSNPTTVES